ATAKAATTSLRQHLLRTGQELDPWQYLSDAAAALDSSDWPSVQRNTSFFDNIVRPQDYARSDQLRCDPHSLDFMVHDFDAGFHQRYRTKAALPSDPVPVEFGSFSHQPEPLTTGRCLDLRLVDFDLDDRLDVLLLLEDALLVYHQVQEGRAWTELVRHPLPTGYNRFLAADLYMVDDTKRSRKMSRPADAGEAAGLQGPRHNTYMGIVLFGDQGIRILRNNLDLPADTDSPVFDTVAQPTGFSALRGILAICPGDLDHDGDLDLAVSSSTGISLWFNRGNMTYVNMSSLSSLPAATNKVTTLAAVDWDRDVDLDLLAMGPGEDAFGILENHRHGQFRWRPLNASYPDVAPGTDIRVAELDGNVSWDLVTAGPTGLRTLLTTTSRPGSVKFLRALTTNTSSTSHLCPCDYDNDGHTDLLCLVDQKITLYRGSPAGALEQVSAPGLGDRSDVLGIRVGDLDMDGDLDLAILTPTGFELKQNNGGNANHWLDIRIIGKDDEQQTGRVNHYGIGSLLEIQAAGKYQAQVVTAETTHFGLGRSERADLARMLLTNGIPQGVVRPATNQLLAEPQVTKGSCPFIYTWRNGSFEFLTDCLWGAPIGLQVAEGTTVPGRPWEYLAIRGQQLHPENGVYRIKFTEELWEAAYFDHAKLLVVDHPANTDIYTNEKVGPAVIAQPAIHSVGERRLPRAVTDQHGNSLAEPLAAADGHYAKAYDTKYRQGLVDEHFIEIDLGPLPAAAPLKLFLTGWIQPTDTSLNIAFSQNPDLSGPRLPYLQTLDTQGNWQTIMSYMGFPGGKNKTIVVDLSEHLLPQSNRIRVVTSAEIYWDHIFFTTVATEAPMNVTVVLPNAAHLQYRGFSQRLPRQPLGPELFTHASKSTAPLWPPMHGNFTRYGSVLPLLTKSDDQMVILGSGDALLVEFPVPPRTLPKGWTRDFILHTVGWDKDADLNTVYGQTVEPLPFQAMTSYPTPPTQLQGTSLAYRDYLDRYQNRRQHPLRFWRYVHDYLPEKSRQ
ncbi:MAG: VCBS repeat-containing protein, partial [Pirellulaceae bacterium]